MKPVKPLVYLVATVLVTSCGGPQSSPVGPTDKGAAQDRTIPLPPKAYPSAMAYADDGSLWVTEKSISAAARIGPHDHVDQYRIPGESNEPGGILQGPDGKMWFVGFEVIGRFETDGRITGWQTGQGSSLGLPSSFTLGPGGSVWYTESGTPSVRRVDAGKHPTLIADLPQKIGYTFPAARIATGPDEAVWFSMISTSASPDIIERVDANGRVSTWNLPDDATPWGIAPGSDGALWFSERTGIGRITVSGEITHHPVRGERPQDIVAGDDGNLWFVTPTQLGKITTSGQITMYDVAGAKKLRAVLPSQEGGFWLADVGTDTVRHFTPA